MFGFVAGWSQFATQQSTKVRQPWPGVLVRDRDCRRPAGAQHQADQGPAGHEQSQLQRLCGEGRVVEDSSEDLGAGAEKQSQC